ncbi:MAG TPA: glycosyltransferase family 2 protein [Alphaproteobacteria bacterium]|nr:glycosyltransferase family 2 protein [Alphaproteobacteria bacterium]
MSSISIAMATYNGGRFIGEQLESLAAQTVKPAELVITDDSSTDNTLEVVRAFAAKAPFPVRIEKNEDRLGYRGNFMRAANLCNSDIIAFCDQDDVWRPHKLEKMLKLLEQPDVLLAFHDALAVTQSLEVLSPLGIQSAPSHLNPHQTISPWWYGLGFTLVFKRSLLDYTQFWPLSADFFKPQEREAHDQWFYFLASCLGSITYDDEPLVFYRQHTTNTEGWKPSGGALNRLKKMWSVDTLSLLRERGTGAGHRAVVMEKISQASSGPTAERASSAAKGYSKLAEGYTRREAIYTGPTLGVRLKAFGTAHDIGAYQRPWAWGVGGKEGLRDLIRGVLFPRKSA